MAHDPTDPDGQYLYAGSPPPVDVNAIDSSEGWDHLYENRVNGFSNPDEMVTNVLDSTNGAQINQLQIVDHGGPTGFQEMGEFDDTPSEREMREDPEKAAQFDATMGRLKGHFSDEGHINMAGCETGKGELGTDYLKRVVNDTGVPVSGAIEVQSGASLGTDKPYYEDQATKAPGAFKTCLPAEKPEDIQCYVEDPTSGMTYSAEDYDAMTASP